MKVYKWHEQDNQNEWIEVVYNLKFLRWDLRPFRKHVELKPQTTQPDDANGLKQVNNYQMLSLSKYANPEMDNEKPVQLPAHSPYFKLTIIIPFSSLMQFRFSRLTTIRLLQLVIIRLQLTRNNNNCCYGWANLSEADKVSLMVRYTITNSLALMKHMM